MTPESIIVLVVLLCIAVAIILYLVISKKRGNKCIGCPYANSCNKKCDNKPDKK